METKKIGRRIGKVFLLLLNKPYISRHYHVRQLPVNNIEFTFLDEYLVAIHLTYRYVHSICWGAVVYTVVIEYLTILICLLYWLKPLMAFFSCHISEPADHQYSLSKCDGPSSENGCMISSTVWNNDSKSDMFSHGGPEGGVHLWTDYFCKCHIIR